MELTLTLESGAAAVACDGHPSHTFDLVSLMPDPAVPGRPPHPLADPVAYGQALYAALFPPCSLAREALERGPTRLLLVALDDALDAIPWEYAYGPGGCVVLDVPFVRGVPAERRVPPPSPDGGLHIVAVPSNPLDAGVAPLNIDGEWQRLVETIGEVSGALTLERVRPPTLDRLRRAVANQRHRVVHFMGHGGQTGQGAILCFEQDDGGLAPATAQDFARRIRGTAFLVTLNACVSATPGPTEFNNLARALVWQQIPYALGMSFSILDDDARALSRALYGELARGVPVEEALWQARNELVSSRRRWAIGVPVLYTALDAPAPGFNTPAGAPQVRDPQPNLDVVPVLQRAEGAFQGRVAELRAIGAHLTGDARPRVLTIHGAGGQGKTVLAREAVERFAWAWPGGVVALSLENLPSRERLAGDLARFLSIDTGALPDPAEVERQVLARLGQRRTLIVLDNAETLVAAVEAGQPEALRLAELIQRQLPGPQVTLLITSRSVLGWPGEEHVGLGGLADDEGALLFQGSAPQRRDAVELALAAELSRKVAGHPLSLRLLGSAFNGSALSLRTFVERHEEQLLAAENKYVGPEHRHRNLYASIDTSVRYLDDDLRALLGGLWVFHAPFLPELAVAVFDPDRPEEEHSPILDRLHALWERSLLVRTSTTLREGTLLLYRLLPTVRPYAERYLPQTYDRETLLGWFASACARLTRLIHDELNRNTLLIQVARQCREDLERGLELATDDERGWYQLRWGWIQSRFGDWRSALAFIEEAMEAGEGADQELELEAMNNLAAVYQGIGQPQRALQLLEQALPIRREVGDRASEAATLNNLAGVYRSIGQPQRALVLYGQALPIRREVGDRAGEAATLNNLAAVYQGIGQPQQALALYEQALPIRREVGDRAGEATTLNNLAVVYQGIGQPERALALYGQALPIRREVGDRAGEAVTLNGMAYLQMDMQHFSEALSTIEQSIALSQQSDYRAAEIAGLIVAAVLLYRHLGRSADAVMYLDRALAIFAQTGLPQDVAGHTPERVRQLLDAMRSGRSLDAPQAGTTVAPVADDVMEAVRAFLSADDCAAARQVVEAHQDLLFRPEVETLFEQNIARATGRNREILELHLQILRDCRRDGIAATFERLLAAPALPFDADLVPRSIAALLGTPQEKLAHAQRLAALAAQSGDADLKRLVTAIQTALFGAAPAGLGGDLAGPYRAAWEAIVRGVEGRE